MPPNPGQLCRVGRHRFLETVARAAVSQSGWGVGATGMVRGRKELAERVACCEAMFEPAPENVFTTH